MGLRMTEGEVSPAVEIYTDGAGNGNPGTGGRGAWLSSGKHEMELNGGEPDQTTNRMELMAAIQALEALKRSAVVRLHANSAYLRNGITAWLVRWKENGCRNRYSSLSRTPTCGSGWPKPWPTMRSSDFGSKAMPAFPLVMRRLDAPPDLLGRGAPALPVTTRRSGLPRGTPPRDVDGWWVARRG